MLKRAVLFAASFLLAAAAWAQPGPRSVRQHPLDKPTPPPSRTEIVRPLKEPATGYAPDLFNRVLDALVIDLEKGPILPLPIAEAGKDLGLNIGVMPVWAVWNAQRTGVDYVMAPSVSYNENLGATFGYKQYFFPDEKSIIMFRGSVSRRVENEAYFYFYRPGVLGTDARFSLDVVHRVTGKPSFYGYGNGSFEADKANYAILKEGEEFTASLPVMKHLFVELNHSLYRQQAQEGPVLGVPQVSALYPADYAAAEKARLFHANRLSILYDDTDHPFLPKIGTLASFSVLYSAKALGSDYNYRTYNAELKHYYNYKGEGRFVTALRYQLQFQRGDELPFYAQVQLGETTGLRMAGDGRFTDRGKIVVNLEERITLSRVPYLKFLREVEVAPFIDAGAVFSDPSGFSTGDLRYGPGLSLRLLLRPQVVATADLAFGSEGTNTILRVGYPF
ncbi:MAG TPA: BamA/TamA family outer membrane protein [Elusimicrobiales bacterium]|nr:BamA/TamA family outer membrane protein [Elusimicrobiales bacterium]